MQHAIAREATGQQQRRHAACSHMGSRGPSMAARSSAGRHSRNANTLQLPTLAAPQIPEERPRGGHVAQLRDLIKQDYS